VDGAVQIAGLALMRHPEQLAAMLERRLQRAGSKNELAASQQESEQDSRFHNIYIGIKENKTGVSLIPIIIQRRALPETIF
jgi:hypothetical protein